jgi:hypothetical protein
VGGSDEACLAWLVVPCFVLLDLLPVPLLLVLFLSSAMNKTLLMNQQFSKSKFKNPTNLNFIT